MLRRTGGNKKTIYGQNSSFFDSSTLKIIFLASAVMVLAVLLTGGISYVIAENAVISKLKSRDLRYIAQSISDKIDGRIARAKETSKVLADDPVIIKWIEGAEKDSFLGQLALQKISLIVNDHDYDNSFIVSSVTNHYWAENGKLLDTMTKDDPDDSWFFQTIASKKPVSISIDFNKERKDTFAFINALAGDAEKPVAVTGVGLNLSDISRQFESYKFGEKSNMWLIDGKGDIYISEDFEQSGRNIKEFLPSDIGKKVIDDPADESAGSAVLEYKTSQGMTYDLIYLPLSSVDWKLVLQIPRDESISILEAIKFNTGIACVITVTLIVLMFYFVSNRIANPYKRAIELAREMEKQVSERTLELREKNLKIMDSIEYARMIQMSILPSDKDLSGIFREHFVLWKPRDVVGGDFYHVRSFQSGYVVIVGDCTGHGVPGALMTMAVNSILNHIIDEQSIKNPGQVLKRINRYLKQTLYGRNSTTAIDDGLDTAVVYVPGAGKAVFAGAKASLYVKSAAGLRLIKGNLKSIGYKNTPDDYEFENHYIEADPDSIFYMTTDGYLHQNGGSKNFSYGRSRFEATISNCFHKPLSEQKEAFENALAGYMAGESQRDDITVLGFAPFRVDKERS